MGISLRRTFVDSFYVAAFEQLLPGLDVLDLGGQKSQKRGRFDLSRYDGRVSCLNISAEKQTDIISDAGKVGIASNQFDVVVCAEVLEHVRDPRVVLSEIFRVLKPNGKLLATVPFLFHIHADPHDYGRYTDYYWRENMSEIGFADISIERQGLLYSVVANFVEQYVNAVQVPRPFGRIAQKSLNKLIANPLKTWAQRHEAKPKVRNNSFLNSYTTGFGICGVKRG